MATDQIKPNDDGDKQELTPTPPTVDHFENVDDGYGVGSSDGLLTVVRPTVVNTWEGDLYELEASSGAGTINHVTVCAYCIYAIISGSPAPGKLKINCKSGATEVEGDEETLTTSFVLYSHQYDVNPDGGGAWGDDWSVIDDLQAGIELYSPYVSDKTPDSAQSFCTMVWVDVDYGVVGNPWWLYSMQRRQ